MSSDWFSDPDNDTSVPPKKAAPAKPTPKRPASSSSGVRKPPPPKKAASGSSVRKPPPARPVKGQPEKVASSSSATDKDVFDLDSGPVEEKSSGKSDAKSGKSGKLGAHSAKKKSKYPWKKIILGFTGLLVLVILASFINARFLNPKKDVVPDEVSGGVSLQNYNDAVVGNSVDIITQVPKSYIAQEKQYAGLDPDRRAFVSAVLSTVQYEVPQVEEKTIYGQVVKHDKQPVMITSQLLHGESVNLKVVDWSKLDTSASTVKAYLQAENLSFQDPDYQVKITNTFCRYVAAKKKAGNLPIKSMKWTPSMDPTSTVVKKKEIFGTKVGLEEDSKLDDLLFSSSDFYNAITKFSESATGQKAGDDWYKWLTGDYEKPEPMVGNVKFIQNNWIGAHHLQVTVPEEAKKYGKDAQVVMPPVGDGSKDSPAGINTSVITSVMIYDKDGKAVNAPIRVEMTMFKRDQDAIDFLQTKDTRNRGLTTASTVKYAAMKYKVTNLSTYDVTLIDNSSLSDDQMNMTNSTGTMYGLQSRVQLKPGEDGVIESWVSSTNLDKAFIIWGKNFDRSIPVVWFRQLAASDGTVKHQTVNDSGTNNSSSSASPSTSGSASPTAHKS